MISRMVISLREYNSGSSGFLRHYILPLGSCQAQFRILLLIAGTPFDLILASAKFRERNRVIITKELHDWVLCAYVQCCSRQRAD